jgi:aryl-alcohol dehydrogenase-like predicted oxidoreductase
MRSSVNSRIALGTVQLGLPYGIANRSGKIGLPQAAAILEMAWREGVDTLDTAAAYGDSEAVLGTVGVPGWRIVSKLPPDRDAFESPFTWVEKSVATSLRRLGVDKLHGLLLHRSGQLLETEGESLYEALTGLREQGLVDKIGYSIYAPEELDALFRRFPPDLVQAPFNVIDRRLATSGWLHRLQQEGVELHVRSVFLQGLLLMDAARRPPYFRQWGALFEAWDLWLAHSGLDPLQACLGFVLARPEIGRIVVGVDSVSHLEQILSGVPVGPVEQVPSNLSATDQALINPSSWRIAS